MAVVHWRFALALGVLGVVLEAFAVALSAASRTSVSGVASLIPYALFVAAIPYLAMAVTDRWWMSTVATLAAAWILMIVLWVPAGLMATWASASGPETYFVVGGGWSNWLLFSGAGVAALALLTTVIGGLTRLAFRSSAA